MTTDPTEFTTFGGFTSLMETAHRLAPSIYRRNIIIEAHKRMTGIALYRMSRVIAENEERVGSNYPESEDRPKRGAPYHDDCMNDMDDEQRQQFLFERAVQRAKAHNDKIPRGGKLMSVPQSPPRNLKLTKRKVRVEFKRLSDEEFESLTPKQAYEYTKRKMRAIQSGGGEDQEYPSHGRADFCHDTTLNNGKAMKETYDLRRHLYAAQRRRVTFKNLRRDLGPWGVNPAHNRWPACFSTCVDFMGVIYSYMHHVNDPRKGPLFSIDPLAIGTVPISTLSNYQARMLTADIWAAMKVRHGSLSNQRARVIDNLLQALKDWANFMPSHQEPRMFSIPLTQKHKRDDRLMCVPPVNLVFENPIMSMLDVREKFTKIDNDEWTVPWPRNSNGSRASDEEIEDFRHDFIDRAKCVSVKITPDWVEPWSLEEACLELIRRNDKTVGENKERPARSLIEYLTSGGCPDALDELMSQDAVALEIADHPA